jgi:hypothetical protein
MLRRLVSIVLMTLVLFPTLACAFELQPLTTRNTAPSVIGFGLPPLEPARLLPPEAWRLQASLDVANNYTTHSNADENLVFDGETYRLGLSAAYGLSETLEVGFELPVISHRGGFLDSFIEGFHDTFGWTQGGRDDAPRDRLDYSYAKDGGDSFSQQSKTTDIGDLSLRAAWQAWKDTDNNRSVALRASLKLPTGSESKLTGSGSTDLALWLSAEQRWQTNSSGELLLYGGGGGLASTNGDLLPDQRRNLAALVSLGCGWQPWSRVGFQLQFDGYSPLYKDSDFKEIAKFAGQLAIGGSLALGEATALELALVEDVLVNTAPDAVFHLALRHQF